MDDNLYEKDYIDSKTGKGKKKTVEIYAEFSNSYGFGVHVAKFKIYLLENLSKITNIRYEIHDLPGANNEYFVYQVIDDKKYTIFTNNAKSHGNGIPVSGEIVGDHIDIENFEDVIKLVKLDS